MNWECELVALKVHKDVEEPPPGAWVSAAIDAMDYIITNDIKVSNHSWGTITWSQALYDAIEDSQSIGHILIASAGNSGADVDCLAPGCDPHYPCGFALPNVICVASTDNDDDKASGSNYGAQSVDLGAPGVNIYSTEPTNGSHGYRFRSGTSMAAPQVTGVVALVASRYPQMSGQDVRYKVLFTVRPPIVNPNPLEGKTVTAGIVDAAAALDCNGNGVLDDLDIANQTSEDCNGNVIPDECEPDEDCNNNSVRDMCDIGAGTSLDCNGNAVPDECDVVAAGTDDCNNNGVPDECEFSTPISGACCLGDGSCEDRSRVSCLADGGTLTCDQACPVSLWQGFCCLPGVSCTLMDRYCCVGAGGTYGGDRTSCRDRTGNPFGACCLQPSGPCIDVHQHCCHAQGGLFFPGSSCQPFFGCPGTTGPSQGP